MHAIMSDDGLMAAMVHAENRGYPEVTRHVAGTMYHLSQHSQGLGVIFRSGGIPALVRMLRWVPIYLFCPRNYFVRLKERTSILF